MRHISANRISGSKDSFRRVAGDPTLNELDLRVFNLLITYIDNVEYRIVDVQAIADYLDTKKKKVRKAIDTLVNAGYIEVGTNDFIEGGIKFVLE